MKNQKFTWDAQEYIKHSSAQYTWAKELLHKLNLSGNESLLDIGCGDGKITVEIASILNEGKVVGIDNSEDMIKTAKNNYPSSQYKNLTFLEMDAREITFKKEFDVAFSNAALHWLTDHVSVLKGIDKALKKSGKVLLQMGGKGNANEIIAIADELIKTPKWKEYFKSFIFPYGFFSPEDYELWLAQTNLKPLRIELIPKDMVHDQESLSGWIRTTWLPYTNSIPENLREEFISEIVERYSKVAPQDSEGKFHVQMIRLEVECYK